VSQYQKGKTNLDFTEARDSQWQWHQLGRMQVCTSLHTDNHASTPPGHHSVFFTGRMPFLPPNQQRQSTEGSTVFYYIDVKTFLWVFLFWSRLFRFFNVFFYFPNVFYLKRSWQSSERQAD